MSLCAVFPTLFELLERRADRDAGRLTPAEQDRVAAECFHCGRCAIDCPYAPELDHRNVDVPRLMVRAEAMRVEHGHVATRRRIADRVLGRPDRRLRRRATSAAPGSTVRRAVAAATGLSAVRLLPPIARQRFSTWFARRPAITFGRRQGRVTVFPTCLVEYHEPAIGHALVQVYERNGVECALSAAGCCGAPLLHRGDVAQFGKVAERNLAVLAAEVRAGTDVVVPQPTCGSVLRRDYVEHVGGPDAELVAAHTHDAAGYLVQLHQGADTWLDVDFVGEVPPKIAYHVACHVRTQGAAVPGRDLLRLTGTDVTLVQQCSGVGGASAYRSDRESTAIPFAERLAAAVAAAGGDRVGDCHLANTAIAEQAGVRPQHPLQVLARAYGEADGR